MQARAAVTDYWINSIDTSGVPQLLKPAFSNLGGTCAVAQGGTGDTGTAWTAYTPTFNAATGTYTSASASGYYKTLGKTCFFKIQLNISDPGTADGCWNVSLPFGASTSHLVMPIAGRNDTSLVSLCCNINADGGSVQLRKYDGTFPGGVVVLQAAGVYEIA